MKIELTINADYKRELYLHDNSDELKNELLSVIERFIGKNVSIDYKQEDAQIDAMSGEIVNYNPYPIKRQYNYKYDKEYMSLQREIPVIVL